MSAGDPQLAALTDAINVARPEWAHLDDGTIGRLLGEAALDALTDGLVAEIEQQLEAS